MGRTLPLGRNSKQDPGETIRKAGLIESFGNKGIFGNYLDQLLYEGHGYEYILGSASQLSAEFANITWDQTQQRFEDKDGSEVVLDDWDRIAIIGMDTLTADMVIDNVENLTMFHIGNTPGQSGDNPKFQLGDAGSGVPYKIKFGPNTANCKLNLLTDKSFSELSLSLTQSQRQYIANQGRGNYITVNREDIYHGSNAGNIVKRDTLPLNPYLLRVNGSLWPMSSDVAVNGQAWFRDLNLALGGFFTDSGGLVEFPSRFTTSATLAATQYLFALNKANRFFTDISTLDARLHSRTDPTGAAFTVTAAFNGTNVVTFSGFPPSTRPREWMRIQGGTVPGGSGATTILRNYNETTNTAKMYDALTGAPVNVGTASGVTATIDNSGAAGGSHDVDYLQNITGDFDVRAGNPNIIVTSGAFSRTVGGGTTNASTDAVTPPNVQFDLIQFDASNSPSARTHTQTQPISSGAYYFYKA